jgi:hypothetical protein
MATKTSAQQPTKADGKATTTGTTAVQRTTTTGTTAAQKTGTINVGGEKGRVAFGLRRGCIKWAQEWPAPQREVILEQCKKLPR